jgi:hypothetical protein
MRSSYKPLTSPAVADLDGTIVDYDIVQSRADYGDGLFRTDVHASALGWSGQTTQLASLRGWRINLPGGAFSERNMTSVETTIEAIGLDSLISFDFLTQCLAATSTPAALSALDGWIILESFSIHPQVSDQGINEDIERALKGAFAGLSHAVIHTPLSREGHHDAAISVWDGACEDYAITQLRLNRFSDAASPRSMMTPTHVPHLHLVH